MRQTPDWPSHKTPSELPGPPWSWVGGQESCLLQGATQEHPGALLRRPGLSLHGASLSRASAECWPHGRTEGSSFEGFGRHSRAERQWWGMGVTCQG